MTASRKQLTEQIVSNYAQFKRLMHGHYQHAFTQLGITGAQLEILIIVKECQPVSHKSLATRLQLTPGAVSQLLDGLDKLNCIERKPDPNDRRVNYVSLSPGGVSKLMELKQLRQRLFADAFKTLDDQELAVYEQVQQKMITWFANHPPKHK